MPRVIEPPTIIRAEKKRIDAWTAAGMSLSRNSNLAKKRARFMATANAPSAVLASFLRSSGPRLNALTTRAPRTVSSMTVVTSARRWRLSHEKPHERLPHAEDRNDVERDRHEHDEREQRVLRHEEAGDREQDERVADDVRDEDDEVLHGDDVGHGAGDELSGGDGVERARIEGLEPLVQPDAQLELEMEDDARDELIQGEQREGREEGEDGEPDREGADGLGLLDDPVVDEVPEGAGRERDDGRLEKGDDHRQDDPPDLPPTEEPDQLPARLRDERKDAALGRPLPAPARHVGSLSGGRVAAATGRACAEPRPAWRRSRRSWPRDGPSWPRDGPSLPRDGPS